MGPSDREKIQNSLESVLRWTQQRLTTARDADDVRFLESIARYARSSLKRLPAANSIRRLQDLHRRVEKLQTATVLYIQQGIAKRKI
jgi:hypothetical protein